jgi:uncharacterized protein YndB with AHSA1/START domain
MGILGWSLTTAGLLAGLVSVATIVGCFMPRRHVAARTLTLRQPPPAVWAVIRDGQTYPEWWGLIKSVTRLPDRDGKEVWQLDYKDGNRFELRVDEADEPRRLVLRIDDAKKLFEGTWDYALEPAGDGGSRLTLTEHGEINVPFVRLMARLLMSPHMYIDMHLKALAAKFGETPVLQ